MEKAINVRVLKQQGRWYLQDDNDTVEIAREIDVDDIYWHEFDGYVDIKGNSVLKCTS